MQAAPLMEKSIVATWSEKGVVNVWDTSKHVILLDAPRAGGGVSKNKQAGHKEKPLYAFTGHKVLYLKPLYSRVILFLVSALWRLRMCSYDVKNVF